MVRLDMGAIFLAAHLRDLQIASCPACFNMQRSSKSAR